MAFGVDDAELSGRVVAFYSDTLRESPDAFGLCGHCLF